MLAITVVPLLFFLHAYAATLVDRQFPHLIVPVKQDEPDRAFNTQYSGEIAVKAGAHQVYTEISFDVPTNAAQTCNLAFTIAPANGPWTLSGDPAAGPLVFNISSLPNASINKDKDTWNSRPKSQEWVASVEVAYNGNVKLTGGSVVCAKGSAQQFVMYPGSARDFGLTWFELTQPLHGVTYEMYVP
ncbi:hypothetical protein K469DRAFT_642669 [Zopfia rhizophila CBS 207.26]|uniref:Ubiquitin 3 binding protein But2 C-terminal domain-containing protein n=1 Tax=Zopfia rhizophila CBS 207.26 TaxID=1314779 RepID=A0A6A6DJM0_9PEZI|nr:hypothetical protein K469DRAFT_642669 [Zopfia rhizophila CBS 207.26]